MLFYYSILQLQWNDGNDPSARYSRASLNLIGATIVLQVGSPSENASGASRRASPEVSRVPSHRAAELFRQPARSTRHPEMDGNLNISRPPRVVRSLKNSARVTGDDSCMLKLYLRVTDTSAIERSEFVRASLPARVARRLFLSSRARPIRLN